MIWVIASVPFWIVGGFAGIGGSAGLLYGAFSGKIGNDEFKRVAPVAAIMALVGGILMTLAAHLCS